MDEGEPRSGETGVTMGSFALAKRLGQPVLYRIR